MVMESFVLRIFLKQVPFFRGKGVANKEESS